MGTDVWKITYENIFDHLSDEELDFLLDWSAEQDDGNYYITGEILDEATEEMEKEEISKLQNLIDVLREQFKKDGYDGMTINFG